MGLFLLGAIFGWIGGMFSYARKTAGVESKWLDTLQDFIEDNSAILTIVGAFLFLLLGGAIVTYSTTI